MFTPAPNTKFKNNKVFLNLVFDGKFIYRKNNIYIYILNIYIGCLKSY